MPASVSSSASSIISSQVVGGFVTRSLRYQSSCGVGVERRRVELVLEGRRLDHAGEDPFGHLLAAACPSTRSTQPALANSAGPDHVHADDVDGRVLGAEPADQLLALLAGVGGQQFDVIVYSPFDSSVQRLATSWIVPPGWIATNQLRVTPLPELSSLEPKSVSDPHPVRTPSSTISASAAVAPRRRRSSKRFPLSRLGPPWPS